MRLCGVAMVLVLLAGTSAAGAQEWARKMFDATSHDFGTVARGSKIEHRFKITNLYEEDVHITAVRSSCGCTTPEIAQRTLKTFESAELVATFNTRDFLGQRSATLTVTFDQPFFAEAQVQINGYVRSDVVLEPAAVEFGTLEAGTPKQQPVQIHYAGRSDWKILQVKSPRDYLHAELREVSRDLGEVRYEVVVRIDERAPAGFFQDYLLLVTNDQQTPEFPLEVSARVQTASSVSPNPLVLGVLEPGQTVVKKLVVRGKAPFRIVGVECPLEGLTCPISDEAKTVHVLGVTFQAPDKPSSLAGELRITTEPRLDLPNVMIRGEVSGERVAGQ